MKRILNLITLTDTGTKKGGVYTVVGLGFYRYGMGSLTLLVYLPLSRNVLLLPIWLVWL
jgi:hypothetical protein